MPSRPEAGLYESSEQARAHRHRAGGRVGVAGRRVRGRVQPAGRLSGSGRPGNPLSGGGTSPGSLGAAAAQAPASPGRPGMGMAGRAGRYRTGRVQRAADRGHPGGRSRQCRGRHRSGSAGHRYGGCGRRRQPPHPPSPPRRSRGNRRIRSRSARRRHGVDLERNRAAAVGRGARRRRGHIPAGRTSAAPAWRTRRHDLCLLHGRHPAAGRRRRGQVRRGTTDTAHTHRDSTGRAVLPRRRCYRHRVHRLVRGHETPRGRPHRTVQRTDPHRLAGRRRTSGHGHHHAASVPRGPHRPRRRDPRPRPYRVRPSARRPSLRPGSRLRSATRPGPAASWPARAGRPASPSPRR